MKGRLRISVTGCGPGHRCIIGMGPVNIGVDSQDAVDALHAASGIATNLASTMAAHPELAPLFGPVAGPLNAINIASKAVKDGSWKHLSTAMPVAASVVSSLLKGLL
jgi:hypothetical protein